MSARLSDATLDILPAEIVRPTYDRAALKTGVVHLGVGAFHRAHQAVVFDDCLAGGDLRWGIVGVSLRSAGVRDQLRPQDGLYSVVVRDDEDRAVRVIGAVRRVLVAPEDPEAVIAAMADPDVHIVTLTITEKGYKLDPATGTLMVDDPDVAADLSHLSRPRTAAGFVVAALARRRANGIVPFTAISCDNLSHNGARLRAAVLAIAEAHDPELAAWIGRKAAFPQTMVDRIVPATDAAQIKRLARETGMVDAGMVQTEPFLQWVIEDDFCGPRPDFRTAGVTVASSVEPWEAAKLRLLNGAHSAIAYLGGLAGIEHVDQFVAMPEGRALVERLWDEAAATLTPPPGLEIAAYRAALMTRFANSALHHRTRQIASDGSQKLPQRLLAPIADRIASRGGYEALALAVAAWMRWVGGDDDADVPHRVDDPLAGAIEGALAGATDAPARVRALLALRAIFPEQLASNAEFATMLVRHLDRLELAGALATIRHAVR